MIRRAIILAVCVLASLAASIATTNAFARAAFAAVNPQMEF